MYIHDLIKISYTNKGYLPNYPYHLISDEEMFDAFLKEDGFFADNYPCPSEELADQYTALVNCIKSKIDDYLANSTQLPDWVYSYMILSTITYTSPEADIAYLAELEGIELNGELAEFDKDLAEACYNTSSAWLQKQPSVSANRVPTMFGEPHVIKSLRLNEANILID